MGQKDYYFEGWREMKLKNHGKSHFQIWRRQEGQRGTRIKCDLRICQGKKYYFVVIKFCFCWTQFFLWNGLLPRALRKYRHSKLVVIYRRFILLYGAIFIWTVVMVWWWCLLLFYDIYCFGFGYMINDNFEEREGFVDALNLYYQRCLLAHASTTISSTGEPFLFYSTHSMLSRDTAFYFE